MWLRITIPIALLGIILLYIALTSLVCLYNPAQYAIMRELDGRVTQVHVTWEYGRITSSGVNVSYPEGTTEEEIDQVMQKYIPDYNPQRVPPPEE